MEEGMTTRKKIIYETLRLFSERGYDGVSMREIVAAVGIKGASIYNHFKGKEMIFQEIFIEMTKRYDDFAKTMYIPIKEGVGTINHYLHIEEEQLFQTADGLFSFFTQDEFAVRFRKMIISEQYKFDLAATYLEDYYMEAPIRFQTEIFKGLQEQGGFTGYDPEVMALHFYSPIYFMLNKYDLEGNYDWCVEQLKKYVHWFCELYGDEIKQNLL